MAVRSEHRYFSGAEVLCADLAAVIAADLRAAIQVRGQASMAVSGGRTPVPLFRALSQTELAWDKVSLTLVDERWVGLEHADSNEALVRQYLLAGPAAAARFIGLKTPAETPFAGLAEVEARLATLSEGLDVVVLGMGDDGHSASWFPQAPQLQQALHPADGARAAVTDPVTASHLRMTLTLPVVLAARRVLLHISGAGKWPVYQQALQDGPLNALPIRNVIHSDKAALDVYWSN